MNESKCRLCLCLVDKKMSFFCSLNDDSFRTMIKTVFPFPVPVDHTVAGKTYNLPVLVCFLCSTTVRNFYSFSKLAEANQSTLQTDCSGQDAAVSGNNLIEYIKADPGVDFEVSDDVLRIPMDSEAAENVNGLNSSTMEPLGEHSSDPLGATTHVMDHGYTRKDELAENPNCLVGAQPVTSEGSKLKWEQRKPVKQHVLPSQKVALRLIKAVKARPCIWMVRDKTYKNMIAKDLAWSAISSELGGSVEDAKKKWRNLTIQFYNNRKTYGMNKRNGSGAVKPSWYAYEALEFMEQVPARPIRVGALHQRNGKREHHKHQTKKNVEPESNEYVEKAEFRTDDSDFANGRPGNTNLLKSQ